MNIFCSLIFFSFLNIQHAYDEESYLSLCKLIFLFVLFILKIICHHFIIG